MTNIIEISSLQNEIVKSAVKLQDSKYRKSSKLILVDGDKTISGLIDDNQEFEYLFLKKDNKLLNKAKAKNLVIVNDDILKKISTVKTPCSMAGIIKEPEIDKNIFLNLRKIALIEDIKDPGNLGTIIRSASAFSIDGIILFGESIDLYNTKVIRSSAQNTFKIPVIKTSDIGFIEKLKNNHELISTVVSGGEDFMKYDFKDNFIIAFGSEANGLSKKITDISNKKLTLFMDNNVESLNLGICASIAFFKIKFNT